MDEETVERLKVTRDTLVKIIKDNLEEGPRGEVGTPGRIRLKQALDAAQIQNLHRGLSGIALELTESTDNDFDILD